MTSQTPEETHNTEVEDVADELLWSLTPKSNCGCGGYLDYDDSRTKILETLHHQLQKAREEERERIKEWAGRNCWTEDDAITDLPEEHQWNVDYHELLEVLSK